MLGLLYKAKRRRNTNCSFSVQYMESGTLGNKNENRLGMYKGGYPGWIGLFTSILVAVLMVVVVVLVHVLAPVAVAVLVLVSEPELELELVLELVLVLVLVQVLVLAWASSERSK